MNLTFHLNDGTLSAAEFRDRTGPLDQREKDFLKKTRETVIARLEPVEDRIVRYESYFDVDDVQFKELSDAVHKLHERSEGYVNINKLSKSESSTPCYSLELGHTTIRATKMDSMSGKVLAEETAKVAEVAKGAELAAWELSNHMVSLVSKVMTQEEMSRLTRKKQTAKLILLTSHPLNSDGLRLEALAGGFRDKRPPTGTAFKGTPEDPIVGVPLVELLNFALHANNVPAVCQMVQSTSSAVLAATKLQDWSNFGYLSLNLSDGCGVSTTEWSSGRFAGVRDVDLMNCIEAVPTNNVDNAFNFLNARTAAAANPLTNMITTEAIGDLTRMAWYYVEQEKAPAKCYVSGSLSCTEVLTVVYHPDKANSVVRGYLGDECTDAMVQRFTRIAKAIVRRNQLMIAALVIGTAEASGRVYEGFGVGRVLVRADCLSEFPAFLKSIEEVASQSVGGSVEMILKTDLLSTGAALICANPIAIGRSIPSPVH